MLVGLEVVPAIAELAEIVKLSLGLVLFNSNMMIFCSQQYSCVKTSKARLTSLPKYLSGRSSASYAVRPVFVIKLYIAATADKLYPRSPARCTLKPGKLREPFISLASPP